MRIIGLAEDITWTFFLSQIKMHDYILSIQVSPTFTAYSVAQIKWDFPLSFLQLIFNSVHYLNLSRSFKTLTRELGHNQRLKRAEAAGGVREVSVCPKRAADGGM